MPGFFILCNFTTEAVMSKRSQSQSAQLTITILHGQEINDVIPELAALRIRVFRDFPYLYDGNETYERAYLATYTECPDSIVVLCWDGDTLVGASTGLPLSAEVDEFRTPFLNAGINDKALFYCAESVLLHEYRGRGVYRQFFEAREAHARALGLTGCVFCAVERPEDHPLRPNSYQSLNSVWRHMGYQSMLGILTSFSWKDINEDTESAKPMQFYLKNLF
jgi:GNAT superfamily N-acetyltransferase